MQKNWNSHTLLEAKLYSHFAKQCQRISSFLESYDTVIPLLSTYPKEIKTYVHMKITHVYNSFIYNHWKHNTPQIAFKVHSYIRKWLSNKNEQIINAQNNVDKSQLLCKSQTQKATHYMISFIWHYRKGKVIRTGNILMITRVIRWE